MSKEGSRPVGEPIDLEWLVEEVSVREPGWASQSAAGQVRRGLPTDKPAAWVSVECPPGMGELIVWVSGEAELTYVPGEEQDPVCVHLELAGRGDLQDAMDELEWQVGVVPQRRAEARLGAVHARWASAERNRDTGSPDYRDDWYQEQCGGCWHWLALAGRLGADWGVCANEATTFDGSVRFEHDGCTGYLASPDGFGTQRG